METTALLHTMQSTDVWAVALAILATISYMLLLRGKSGSSAALPSKSSLPGTDKPPRLNIRKGPFDMGEVRVSKILVHPIKSCRGTSVAESKYTPSGLENDRKWCILDAETKDIMTAREVAKLVLIEPKLRHDPSSPHRGQLIVTVPSSSANSSFSVPIQPTAELLASWPIIEDCMMFGTYRLDGYVCQSLDPKAPSPSQVLSEYLGKDVQLVMKGPRVRVCAPTPTFPNLKAENVFQDGYPLLVASEESLRSVGESIRDAAAGTSEQIGKIGGLDEGRWKNGDIEIERFRPNIVVKGAGVPFAEDAWQKISVGNATDDSQTISLVSKCARCLLPNVDTKSGVRDAAVPYKVIMKVRTGIDPQNMNKPCFGCNGVPGGSGVVKVGDLITVQEWMA